MSDVLVEPEAARVHGDIASVVPVGNVDVVTGQERHHGLADQSREVPGEPWYEKHARLVDRGLLLEPQQRAERRAHDRALTDGHIVPVELDALDPEGRTAVRQLQR